jgi:hypothetical protein
VVKTLVALFISGLVGLCELAGVVLLAVVAGLTFGVRGVLVVVGVALLAKSMELDVRRGDSKRGGS